MGLGPSDTSGQSPSRQASGRVEMQAPAVAMLGFPTEFQLRRVTSDRRISAEETVDRANFKGSGGIRPDWRLPGDDVRLIIRVDDAAKPQVNALLKWLFAVLHELEPCIVDGAAYSVLLSNPG